MPANVPLAAATAVLPDALSKAFTQVREYAVLTNEYADGASQREAEVTNSRRRWVLTRRLAPALLTQLRACYDARKGGAEPFLFYDPFESASFAVRFEGDWQQPVGLCRGEVSLRLVELAQAVSQAESLEFDAARRSAHLISAGF